MMKGSLQRWLSGSEKDDNQIQQIRTDDISPSPYQPRTRFDDERLDELCQTIRVHGIIQPIVVRKQDYGYELIAGERRLRAVQKLQLPTIPAIIKSMSDSQAASVSLIENLQREELTAIEEAHAYQQLIDLHQLTQESLAQRLGKGQSTIANKLRLLQLSKPVQDALLIRSISERHARALLSMSDKEHQQQMLKVILAEKLTVKQTEERIKRKKQARSTSQLTSRKSVSRDVRIAMNTIRKSIKMIQESGISVETHEFDEPNRWEVKISVKK